MHTGADPMSSNGMDAISPAASAASHHHPELSASGLGYWMAMVAAMMLPAILPMTREISLQSLWSRRYRSAAFFLGGYLVVWAAFGMLAIALWTLAGHGSAPALTELSLLAGALWGLSRAKRRHLKLCHRFVSTPPQGWSADLAGLTFGFYTGWQCLLVCWPVMLAMVFSHSLVLMLGLAMLVTWELLARLPRLVITAAVLGGLAVIWAFAAM